MPEENLCTWRDEPCGRRSKARRLCDHHRYIAVRDGRLDEYPTVRKRILLDGRCAYDEPDDSSACGGSTLNFARGLCQYHYAMAHDHGRLDKYALNRREAVHRLRDIDWETKRGICEACGPVRVVGTPGSRQCWNAHAARVREQRTGVEVPEEEFQRLLRLQGGGCGICGGQSPRGERLDVDHDHETGAVRGLLCRDCNLGLGKLGDDLPALRRVRTYLKRAALRAL